MHTHTDLQADMCRFTSKQYTHKLSQRWKQAHSARIQTETSTHKFTNVFACTHAIWMQNHAHKQAHRDANSHTHIRTVHTIFMACLAVTLTQAGSPDIGYRWYASHITVIYLLFTLADQHKGLALGLRSSNKNGSLCDTQKMWLKYACTGGELRSLCMNDRHEDTLCGDCKSLHTLRLIR